MSTPHWNSTEGTLYWLLYYCHLHWTHTLLVHSRALTWLMKGTRTHWCTAERASAKHFALCPQRAQHVPGTLTVAGTPVAAPRQVPTSRLSPRFPQGARSSHGPEGRAAPPGTRAGTDRPRQLPQPAPGGGPQDPPAQPGHGDTPRGAHPAPVPADGASLRGARPESERGSRPPHLPGGRSVHAASRGAGAQGRSYAMGTAGRDGNAVLAKAAQRRPPLPGPRCAEEAARRRRRRRRVCARPASGPAVTPRPAGRGGRARAVPPLGAGRRRRRDGRARRHRPSRPRAASARRGPGRPVPPHTWAPPAPGSREGVLGSRTARLCWQPAARKPPRSRG